MSMLEATDAGDAVSRAAGMLIAAGMLDVELTVDTAAGAVAISVAGHQFSTVVEIDDLVDVVEHWLRTRSAGTPYSIAGHRLDGAPCI